MSLVATRLQNWRVSNPELDRNSTRPCEYGALNFFVRETNSPISIISQNLKDKAFASIGNTLQVPVIDTDGEVNVASTRTCTIADDDNTSSLYTVVWQTLQVGFTMVPASYSNNEIGYQHDYNRKMEKVCRALANKLDEKAVAALEASKTQVLKDKLNYEFTANVIEAKREMAGDLLGDLGTMMRSNCFYRQINVIGNGGVESLVRKLSQHGIYNDTNKQNEYMDKVFHFTNNVTNATGQNGTLFAVESGNVGVLTRVDREALRGAKSNGHEWGVTRLPYIDLPVGYHYYTAVGDQSATNGDATADLVCGVKEYFGFSMDVAFVIAHNSAPATYANPIIKAQIAAAAQNQPFATPIFVVNGGGGVGA